MLGKKVSLLALRQVLTKLLPAACIQLHNYDLFEKARLKVSLLYKTVSIRIISQNHTPGISLLKKNIKKILHPQVYGLASPLPYPFTLTFMENPWDGRKS